MPEIDPTEMIPDPITGGLRRRYFLLDGEWTHDHLFGLFDGPQFYKWRSDMRAERTVRQPQSQPSTPVPPRPVPPIPQPQPSPYVKLYPAEHAIWCGIKSRCYNKNVKEYPDYGARGITVCDEWRKSFAAFFEAVGPRPTPQHSIGRINNDGPYEPANVEWQSKETQMNNTRRNVFVEFRGERLTLVQACRLVKLSRHTLATRIRLGWSMDRALTTPAGPSHPQTRHTSGYKLTEADIPIIRQMFQDGATKRAIAKTFGITSCSVKRVIDRKSWGHIL
jgi:hypothetical protein